MLNINKDPHDELKLYDVLKLDRHISREEIIQNSINLQSWDEEEEKEIEIMPSEPDQDTLDEKIQQLMSANFSWALSFFLNHPNIVRQDVFERFVELFESNDSNSVPEDTKIQLVQLFTKIFKYSNDALSYSESHGLYGTLIDQLSNTSNLEFQENIILCFKEISISNNQSLAQMDISTCLINDILPTLQQIPSSQLDEEGINAYKSSHFFLSKAFLQLLRTMAYFPSNYPKKFWCDTISSIFNIIVFQSDFNEQSQLLTLIFKLLSTLTKKINEDLTILDSIQSTIISHSDLVFGIFQIPWKEKPTRLLIHSLSEFLVAFSAMPDKYTYYLLSLDLIPKYISHFYDQNDPVPPTSILYEEVALLLYNFSLINTMGNEEPKIISLIFLDFFRYILNESNFNAKHIILLTLASLINRNSEKREFDFISFFMDEKNKEFLSSIADDSFSKENHMIIFLKAIRNLIIDGDDYSSKTGKNNPIITFLNDMDYAEFLEDNEATPEIEEYICSIRCSLLNA